MAKALLSAALLVLLVLAACSEPTPTTIVTPTATPRPTELPATAPSPRPTETPTTAPEPTATPAPPEDEPPAGRLTPLLLDAPEAVAAELSEQELACMAGTADTERLSRIFSGSDEPKPEEWNVILGCLRDETQLKLLVGAFVEDPGPLSTEASECIRTAFEGINLRLVMLAATQDNELDDTLILGVFVTVACLNYEDWDAASKVFELDPSERQITLCLMGAIGRTRGLAAALEAKGEDNDIGLLAEETGCELEERGPRLAPSASTVTPEPGPDPATPEPAAGPVGTTVILVAPVPPDIPEYDHSQWKHWADADGDCQDTRQELLIRESLSEVTFETDRRCQVETGWWHGAFTRTRVNNPSELDIDHRVPLQNAHRSGGWAWTPEKKEEYANYLDLQLHLVAVAASVNRSRGAKGPEEWRPPDEVFWCEYAQYWSAVKAKWELTMTGEEANAVKEMLDTCPGEVRVIELKG